MPSREPKLKRLSEQSIDAERFIVFVHGIFSDHEACFAKMIDNLRKIGAEPDFDLWVFDYDYLRPLSDSGDALAEALNNGPFRGKQVDLVGHSMGGLVSRLAVLRHSLPFVRRVVTLATPNHGAVNGVQLNLIAQLTVAAARKLHPLYARAPGIFELNAAHKVMAEAIETNIKADPSRLDGKSYVSIPAQYYHSKLQFGDPPPSLLMGGVTATMRIANWLTKQQLVKMTPVHDGIVEERSNQLSPSPAGSTSEASYMPSRGDELTRVLHVTHEEAAKHDHVTIAGCPEVAELILAVLKADGLQAGDVDPHLTGHPNRVRLRPLVI